MPASRDRPWRTGGSWQRPPVLQGLSRLAGMPGTYVPGPVTHGNKSDELPDWRGAVSPIRKLVRLVTVGDWTGDVSPWHSRQPRQTLENRWALPTTTGSPGSVAGGGNARELRTRRRHRRVGCENLPYDGRLLMTDYSS